MAPGRLTGAHGGSAAQRSARGEVSRGRGAHPEKVALEPELVSAPPFNVVLNHNGSDWHALKNCGSDPLTKPQAAMHGFLVGAGSGNLQLGVFELQLPCLLLSSKELV